MTRNIVVFTTTHQAASTICSNLSCQHGITGRVLTRTPVYGAMPPASTYRLPLICALDMWSENSPHQNPMVIDCGIDLVILDVNLNKDPRYLRLFNKALDFGTFRSNDKARVRWTRNQHIAPGIAKLLRSKDNEQALADAYCRGVADGATFAIEAIVNKRRTSQGTAT